MKTKMHIAFDNSYSRLPARFFERQLPIPVNQPRLIRVNRALAISLGIDPDWLASEAGVQVISGNVVPAGADPIAMAYAGHQFGHWNPQLGDGRAILLGEVVTPAGDRFDFQLKGSGRTHFSRGGDGRAPLGPVLREFLVSEAMAALRVPTTRTLAAVTTGERVIRERSTPAGVLVRIAQSHIRIGTLQFFASRGDEEGLRILVEHVMERHFPAARSAENPLLAMLEEIVARQAERVAQWQALGFIHGVMNTDNMLLSGETIDYGPCAFMDVYHPLTVFSSIDHGGRYAYDNQPRIAHWNLLRLAQALLPLLHSDEERALSAAQDAVEAFPARFEIAYQRAFAAKLGFSESSDASRALLEELLALMFDAELDFTLTFRRLADLAADNSAGRASIDALFQLPSATEPWLRCWRAELERRGENRSVIQARMDQANPIFIPRNHLVEAATSAAIERDDFSVFEKLQDRLQSPHTYEPKLANYAKPPRPHEVVRQTFCGT